MNIQNFTAIKQWEETQDKLDVFGINAGIKDNEVVFLNRTFKADELHDFYIYIEGWIAGALAEQKSREGE